MLPPERQRLVDEAVGRLRDVEGIVAVALGGSWAIGAARPDSDVDLGLYYRESSPFEIDSIRSVAEQIGEGPVTVTGFYEWGAWVNGGAWIPTSAGRIDFLYQNLDQLERVFEASERGEREWAFAQQPTHGFHSVTLLAQARCCIPLHDPDSVLARWKERVERYPPALRRSMVQDSLWAARFTLRHARTGASRGDVYNVAGCLTRAAGCMTQALFALNEAYFLGDKHALATIGSFDLRPDGYAASLERILGHPGNTPHELRGSVAALEERFEEIVKLAGDLYQPLHSL